MEKPSATHIRPYWHVDAKWIAGILLFLSLGACLLLYNLSALSERDRAVDISATIVAGLFSKNGLDDASGVEAFRSQAAQSPDDTLSPIPEFPTVHISKQQALTLSPRDLRVAIFSQITGPIYDKGLEAAAADFTADPAEQKQFTEQASLLGVLTASTHGLVHSLWLASVVVSVLLAVALVCFSAGWGRLVSPGVVLLAISPIGSIAGLILLFPPPGGDGSLQATIPGNVASDIGTGLNHSYLVALLMGIVLLVIALIGKIITVLIKQSRNSLAAVKS